MSAPINNNPINQKQKIETKERSRESSGSASSRTVQAAQERFNRDFPDSASAYSASSQGSSRQSFHSDSAMQRKKSTQATTPKSIQPYKPAVPFSSPNTSQDLDQIQKTIEAVKLSTDKESTWSQVCRDYNRFDETSALKALAIFIEIYSSIVENEKKDKFLKENTSAIIEISRRYLVVSENHQHLTTVISTLSSLNLFGHDPQIVQMVTRLIQFSKEIEPKEYIEIFKAYAGLSTNNEGRLDSNSLNQLMGVKNCNVFFKILTQKIASNIDQYALDNVLSLCESLSQLPIKKERIADFLEMAGDFFVAKKKELSFKKMIVIAGLYAKMGKDHVNLFDCIQETLLESENTIKNLSIEKMIQITDFLIEVEAISPRFLFALASAAQTKIETSSKDQIARLAMNLAESYKMLDAQLRLSEEAGQACQAFLSSLAELSIESFSPSGLTHLAYSFAKIHFAHEPFFKSLGEYALKNLKLFTDNDLALVAYSFTQLDFTHKKLFSSMIETIQCEKLSFLRLSNLLLSFAMSEIEYASIQRFFQYAEDNASKIILEAKGAHLLNTIYHALIYFEVIGQTSLLSQFPKLQFETRLALETIARVPPKSSQLHKSVSKAIEALKEQVNDLPEFFDEYPASGYFLDIAFPKKQACIEIDGAAVHNRKLAKAEVRETILQHHGWTLFVIKEEEWRSKTTPREINSFIKGILNQIAKLPNKPSHNRVESKKPIYTNGRK